MIHLHKLGRKYLDFEFPVKNEARLRIVERPGLWMGRGALEQLLADVRQVAKTVIPSGLDYGVLRGDKRRLDDAILSILYDRASGKPIAFNAYSFLDVEVHGRGVNVLHLGLIMVDPAFQAQGYTWVIVGLPCLMVFLRNGMSPVWITSVTQVPAIFGKVAEAFADVYPSPSGKLRRSFAHLTIARQVMERHRDAFGVGPQAQFDEDNFIIRDAYTSGSEALRKTYEGTTKHRDDAVNEMCRDRLDYLRGDDFLQVGAINFACAREYLLRTVPRDSLPSLLYRLMFVLSGRLLLPLWHWFSPNRQWGDLRPRR
ncbi:MAG: hypothetical protein ACT4PQ_05495 [Betaproteobacteria bacterium]